MTPDQEKALELFTKNSAQNIKHVATQGLITFDEAIYLLQSELLELRRNPYKYCLAAGIQFN